MQLEVGNVLEGKVTGITKFGAFVELAGGKTGMVHISEIAASYVKEITDHLGLNDQVKVKVIGITPEGKISLSIKQAAPQPQPQQQPQQQAGRPMQQGGGRPGGFQQNSGGAASGESRPRSFQRRPPREITSAFERRQPISSDTMSFEDMMSKFKQASDDKISDLKKYTDTKRGTSRGRRSPK